MKRSGYPFTYIHGGTAGKCMYFLGLRAPKYWLSMVTVDAMMMAVTLRTRWHTHLCLAENTTICVFSCFSSDLEHPGSFFIFSFFL